MSSVRFYPLIYLAVMGSLMTGCSPSLRKHQSKMVSITYQLKAKACAPKVNADQLLPAIQAAIESRFPSNERAFPLTATPVATDKFEVVVPSSDVFRVTQSFQETPEYGIYAAKNVKTPLIASREFSQKMESRGRDRIERVFEAPNGQLCFKGTDNFKRMVAGWDRIIDLSDIEKAQKARTRGDVWHISLSLTPTGKEKMLAWCRANKSLEENIVVMLDQKILSWSVVNRGTMLGGGLIETEPDESESDVRKRVERLKVKPFPTDIVLFEKHKIVQ